MAVYDKKIIEVIMSARPKTTSVTLDINAVANLNLLVKKGSLLIQSSALIINRFNANISKTIFHH